MNPLYKVRKSYGNTFVTVFEDGLVVPWHPLSLQDYIQYSQDRNRSIIPISLLEDEIFNKCVIDQSLVRQLPFLKAGIVGTVTINIWNHSGPNSIEEFNNDLEIGRHIFNSNILHELVSVITMAFPYKPEDVYDMDYQTFILRLAQAEKKLLQLGIYLNQPISIVPEEEDIQAKKKRKLGEITQNQPDITMPHVDAKKLWDEQIQKSREEKTQLEHINVGNPNQKWWKISPVLEAPNKEQINFKQEANQQHEGLSGHDKVDLHISRAKMIKDTVWVYADLIKELAKKKKK